MYTIARKYVISKLQVETAKDGGTPSPDTGLYLMSREVPNSGRLKALRACGFRLDSIPRHPVTKLSLIFFVAGYRLIGSRYERLTDQFPFELTIDASGSFGCGNFLFPLVAFRHPKETKLEFLSSKMIATSVPLILLNILAQLMLI